MKGIGIPQAAEQAGFKTLVFEDDFDSAATLDWQVSGKPGFKWYLDRPFGWDAVRPADLTVADSVLTIKTPEHCAGWGPSTYSTKGLTGSAFRYGYFEAKIRFDPALGRHASYFPAWWSFSVAHATDKNDEHWGELDFFEAMPDASGLYKGAYVATVHDWIRENGGPQNHQNTNNWFDGQITDADWHVYGCLWEPGRFAWYLDGRCITEVTYSADGHPTPQANPASFVGCYSFLDKEDMLLILGTCEEWPMEVDWVRVWQK